MPLFRVLAGKHTEFGKSYKRGEIVDSKSDLSKLNSPGAMKFELVDDRGQPLRNQISTPVESPEQPDELNSLTVAELQNIATDEEIAVTSQRKVDLIKSIRAARVSRAAEAGFRS